MKRIGSSLLSMFIGCVMQSSSVMAHATGIGPPDLGGIGNIVFYGLIFVLMYGTPILVTIGVTALVVSFIKRGRSREDDESES